MAVRPYDQARNPPDGALGIDDPPILTRATAASTLVNPLSTTTEVLDQGAQLYRIYCAICHGSDGAGQAPVAEYFRVPDLRAPYIVRYQDGRLYTTIREGRVNMPAYAESLSASERWAVVHHLRTFGNAPQ